MGGGKHLLLLAVLLHLARCQNLQVSMSPDLKQIFCGDLLYLTCKGAGTSPVKWFLDGKVQLETNTTLKIAVASLSHSGSYQCERGAQTSDPLEIQVLEYYASASLTLKTGQPVMKHNGAVVLQLDHDSGLEEWNCWVNRGETTKRIKLKLESNNDLSIVFQPRKLFVLETIFWCTNSDKKLRSNQQVIWTTGKDISLEMYPLPVVVGESLTLRCLVRGTDQIRNAVFYKENAKLHEVKGDTYKINNVTSSIQGKYKCDVTYVHVARTAGDPYEEVSDIQDVFVQESPKKATLSESMSCSCKECEGVVSYHYYKKDGETLKFMGSEKNSMTESGTYACRAVMPTMRSFLSNTMTYQPKSSILTGVIAVVVIMVGVLLIVAAVFYIFFKRRSNTGPIYEDMPMRTKEGGDSYEPLQRAGGKEPEYDTLHTETEGRKKEGEYEGLKKEEMKEGVYHTLGMEGEAAAGGGYEALKKEGMKEGVYHTVGKEGGAAAEGGYEALKKEGMKEGVYHTVGIEGGAAAEGGYEALKKEGMKGDDYQTLGTGDAGGQGQQEQ